MSKYPFIEALRHKAGKEESRFFVPGHKGMLSEIDELYAASRIDLTELSDTDSLFEASGIIHTLEQEIAALYGSVGSFISCGGSTLAIQTMLALSLKPGDKVLMARTSHISAFHAAALLDFEPIWIYPTEKSEDGTFLNLTYSDVRRAIRAYPEAKAVFLTSPDYFGICVDVKRIAKLCKRHDMRFLVDGAHGAHLCLFDEMHPILQGADMVAESFHKTLPSLTGSAMLHIGAGNDAVLPRVKSTMSVFGSTSPSYLMMASIDYARAYIASTGRMEYIRLGQRMYQMKRSLEAMGFQVKRGAHTDPVRLAVSARDSGYSGEELSDYMITHKVIPEAVIGDYVIFVPTPFNHISDFERLSEAFETLPPKQVIPKYLDCDLSAQPEKCCSIRTAFFSERERVALKDALGRIAAENVFTCPPGLPVLVAGERIDQNTSKILSSAGVFEVEVVK